MCKAKVYIEQLKEVYQTIDSDIQRLSAISCLKCDVEELISRLKGEF